jgi:phosphoribosylanthranilate isomerase
MNLKLKVCGMRDASNIIKVASLQPDYMGFIFYEKSKRFVGNDFSIPKEFPSMIKRVGVFVNEKVDAILKLVSKHKLDFVQLHGDEIPEDCKALKQNKVGVIKVFSIDNEFDFNKTKPYQLYTDFFLFDTKSESYGGSGKSFDWNLLKKYDQEIPFFLSGGLSPDNIQNIKELKGMNLHAIDVNSGVEVAPGLKDITKVKSIKGNLNSIPISIGTNF